MDRARIASSIYKLWDTFTMSHFSAIFGQRGGNGNIIDLLEATTSFAFERARASEASARPTLPSWPGWRWQSPLAPRDRRLVGG